MSFRNIFYKFVPFRWISDWFGKNQQNPSTNPVETPKPDSISGTCKSRTNRTKSYSARDYSKPLTPKYGVNVNYRPAQENRYADDNWDIEHRTKSYPAHDHSKPLTPKYGVNVIYRPALENRYTDDNWYIEHYSESCEFEDYEQYYDNGLHGDYDDYDDYGDYSDYGDY